MKIFERLKQGIKRSRQSLAQGLNALFKGRKGLDAVSLESLEDTLLVADVGIEATGALIAALKKRGGLHEPEALRKALREEMIALLEPVTAPLVIPMGRTQPFVILMVGVNGVGKTTTIAKLTKKFKAEGKSVMLAAGDTFRAAAIEQLKVWGERNDVPVIAQKHGGDAASVIFDTLASATARGIDVVIADTAGRLHTQSNLMEELKKIRRVMAKHDELAPHETLLVIDSTNGQNALTQALEFQRAVDIDGIVLTKLDGSAKGGIVFALATQVGVPLRFIGVGESADDLLAFHATEFVDALISPEPADTEINA